jgi:hypothetical protein
MRASVAVTLLASACSQAPSSNEVDIGNAARAAQASVDNYASTDGADRPAISERRKPDVSPAAVRLPPPRAVREHPSASDTATRAAEIVQTYYALIAERQYLAAWHLWDRAGAASGMSADHFAATFAKYADYHAEIGAPGAIDAGAGQRYVTVPVKAHGTLRDGTPFAMEGPVTLHRSGDIDGATQAQRNWRIYETGLKPRPLAAPSSGPAQATP